MWKDKYKVLVEEIAKKPEGSFSIYDLPERPSFLDKSYTVPGDMTYNVRLNERVATEEDYKAYCEYLCDYTGQDLSFYFIDIQQGFSKFKK